MCDDALLRWLGKAEANIRAQPGSHMGWPCVSSGAPSTAQPLSLGMLEALPSMQKNCSVSRTLIYYYRILNFNFLAEDLSVLAF